MPNNIILEQHNNYITIKSAGPFSSLLLVKADYLNTSDSLWLNCESDGTDLRIEYPNLFWKSASLTFQEFPTVIKGERKSPPKGYPTSRRDYAVPDTYRLPIDKKHIRAALSYFTRTQGLSSKVRQAAARKIVSRAKRYGIDVSKESRIAQIARGKK